MKFKKYLLLAVFFSLCISSIAQYEYPGETEDSKDKKEKKKGWYRESKLYFGGNLGLSFGTYTYIELAPIAGYKITPRLWAGLGPKYMYVKERSYYETSVYGIKTFALFSIFKNINEKINIGIGDIFVYAEDEVLNVEPVTVIPFYSTIPPYQLLYLYYQKEPRTWINIVLIGGGFRFPLGERAGFAIMILWDISHNPEYPYQNPEVRFSIDF